METSDLPPVISPVRLAIDDRPVDQSDPFLYHKTTVRSTYQTAAPRHPHADDVILWNKELQVTETTIGNLAIQIAGRWLTPPVSSGLLAGTEGAAVSAPENWRSPSNARRPTCATGLARVNSVGGWKHAALLPIV